MSHSHLQTIHQLLSKESLSQAHVEQIEMHFRAMSNIQDDNIPKDQISAVKIKRQEAFNTFKHKVAAERTCVLSITPEELKEKGINYTIPLAEQAKKKLHAINSYAQDTTQAFADLFDFIMSDKVMDDYASTRENNPEDITPSASDDPLDRMEHGTPPAQEPEQEQEQEQVFTPVEHEVQTGDLDVASVPPVSSESTVAIKPMQRVAPELALFVAESSKLKKAPQTPALAYNHKMLDDLASNINQARTVLLTYLVEEDQQAFNELYDEIMQEFDYLSVKSTSTNFYYTPQEKQAFLERIEAFEEQLKPAQFNFESKQGGLDDEHVSAWFAVKFWLLSTLKSMLNAVGLRSAASFFTPAPSDGEQNKIDHSLQQLKNVVEKFESLFTGLDPDSELEIDSARMCQNP